jgi:hypothetical protein
LKNKIYFFIRYIAMGKNKKKKTKVKTISLEEFTDAQATQDDIVLPTGSMSVPQNGPEISDNYSNIRTPISKESTFFSQEGGDGEIDWSRGSDMSTKEPEQSATDNSDWRQGAEVTGPTSAPDQEVVETSWSRDSVKPTSRAAATDADTDTDWRKSSQPNKPKAYMPPVKGNGLQGIRGDMFCSRPRCH